jgi:NADPH2 dehydrogenase
VEKRARFGLEVAKAVVEAVGAERTAIRMSPFSDFQGMRMENPMPQFTYYTEQLKKLKLAYLHIVERRVGDDETNIPDGINSLIDTWGNTTPVLVAGGYKTDSAYKAVDEAHRDKDIAIVFGRYFISNPDLVFKVKERLELTPYDRSLFYNKTEVNGYTTWKFSKEWEAQATLLSSTA